LVTLVGLLLPRTEDVSSGNVSPPKAARASGGSGTTEARFQQRLGYTGFRGPEQTAEEIVAQKVRQFGQNRRAIAQKIARRLNQELPPEIEAFFDAIEEGNWDEIHSRWKYLATHTHQYEYSKDDRPDLEPFWATVLDTYGVAEQAHEWPAQELLDYGNAILDSLRPDMVYVGGTDNGRWVPTLLNETSGDPHIVLTQNALADGTYLEYLRELYGGRFNTLSQEDSQRAFEEYVADARKRLEHDQRFPDEPKQLRPGEDVRLIDGRVQASGMVAVMGINEKLLQMLMEKNPDLSFAVQESQPMRNTYADAVPLGPLMELGVPDAQNKFTAERATQSVDYWRSITQALLADPEAADSTYALKSYSHDINSTANLLAAHNFNAEAEQAYRLASQLMPSNIEAAFGLSEVLARAGRADEARQVLDDFSRNHPDQKSAIESSRATVSFLWTAPSEKPSP
jgi:tetratricopeptide (TPR) repeat protein